MAMIKIARMATARTIQASDEVVRSRLAIEFARKTKHFVLLMFIEESN